MLQTPELQAAIEAARSAGFTLRPWKLLRFQALFEDDDEMQQTEYGNMRLEELNDPTAYNVPVRLRRFNEPCTRFTLADIYDQLMPADPHGDKLDLERASAASALRAMRRRLLADWQADALVVDALATVDAEDGTVYLDFEAIVALSATSLSGACDMDFFGPL